MSDFCREGKMVGIRMKFCLILLIAVLGQSLLLRQANQKISNDNGNNNGNNKATDNSSPMMLLPTLDDKKYNNNNRTTDIKMLTPVATQQNQSTISVEMFVDFDTMVTKDNILKVDAVLTVDTEESTTSTLPYFCLPWTITVDDWWTHHPGFAIFKENQTHYCLAPILNKAKAELFQNIYKNQFQNNCSNVVTQRMFQSGWGADMAHVVDALYYGLQNARPAQVSNDKPWHYAKAKDDKKIENMALKRNNAAARPAACDLKSMYCYFLDLTNCAPNNKDAFSGNEDNEFFLRHPNLSSQKTAWIVEYITRPQTWLRKAVFDMASTVPLQSPCSVVHVRRSDIVLHGQYSRRYHAMEEYIEPNRDWLTKQILLLTDDRNAIEEAESKYPDIDWVYIDRPRFKGSEGGWENQIPSKDAKSEVIALLSIFRLVQKCQTFVHTTSNLGKYIAGVTRNTHSNFLRVSDTVEDSHRRPFDTNSTVINLDDGLPVGEIYNKMFDVRKFRRKRKSRRGKLIRSTRRKNV